MTQRNLLLTPGPTPVPAPVLRRLAEPMIHHRTPQYRAIFQSVSERLKKVFRTRFPVYTFAGSGTSAMEASIVNFHAPGDSLLVIESGKFGERFTEIARAFGLKPVVLPVPWGEAADPAKVEAELRKNPAIRSVCTQHCETSTAALHDIKRLGEVVSKTAALLIVDAISGLAADKLETDDWKVDIVIAGSQKALMLPPGLAFLSVNDKAKARIAQATLPRYYTDLRLYEKGMKDADTPFTPAVNLVMGLDESLRLIEKETIEGVWDRCAKLAAWTRNRFQSIGLELYSKAPSSTVTAARVPAGLDGEKLIQIMRDEKGVSMAGGQGAELKGKVLRICHMGAITKKDLEEGFGVLEETLQAMKAGKN